jgi:hypothetical protein
MEVPKSFHEALAIEFGKQLVDEHSNSDVAFPTGLLLGVQSVDTVDFNISVSETIPYWCHTVIVQNVALCYKLVINKNTKTFINLPIYTVVNKASGDSFLSANRVSTGVFINRQLFYDTDADTIYFWRKKPTKSDRTSAIASLEATITEKMNSQIELSRSLLSSVKRTFEQSKKETAQFAADKREVSEEEEEDENRFVKRSKRE